jgi:hypothetical protein
MEPVAKFLLADSIEDSITMLVVGDDLQQQQKETECTPFSLNPILVGIHPQTRVALHRSNPPSVVGFHLRHVSQK